MDDKLLERETGGERKREREREGKGRERGLMSHDDDRWQMENIIGTTVSVCKYGFT